MGLDPDTIVARATPPGPGALAVVRLSGPGSFQILGALLHGASVPEPGRPALRWVYDPGDGRRLDRVVVTTRRGPTSYTGEDTVELSGHGGWVAPASLVDACIRVGARAAEPGEFSRRAYLNGKLDLLQAEATLDLVEARSRALQDVAAAGLDRGLSARVAELRATLIALEALLVHHLDFPEEDDPPVPAERIVAEAASLEARIGRLLATAPEGELLREGARTVLAGVPNAGKSSLFNALLGRERAIVTEVPGTTRDALEASAQIGGFPFLLVDTAGLRETEDRVERIGVEVAERWLEQAHLVLFCAEAGRPLSDAEQSFLTRARAPVVLVRTQADRLPTAEHEGSASGSREAAHPGDGGAGRTAALETVTVSAHTGEGLDRLASLLPRLVFTGLVDAEPEQPVVTRRRQREGLERARAQVAAFRAGIEEGLPAEVASAHLRDAETALEGLVGVLPREEVLDHLFREFCIGK
ncbi:MAG: tRNA uridine-5-carboxymethylaminomethyl(34) synthesis GTPase MnmE [Gemmatimonadetes bacterium]|nr:tRNA uridine-5-carboxymethylaminomethyl(34) synthesis GTPase MnmE [Gemmatimonadota bacterium]